MTEPEQPIKNCGFKGFKAFGVFDLILLSMLTALSIAFKTVVGILVRLITGPLGIPGGALAGGLYMLWLPLAIALTGKRGSALVVAAVQTVIMITTGAPGSHGVWTILTYMPPAVLAELVFIYRPKNYYNIVQYIAATVLANLIGTFGINLIIFRMSLIPLLFTLLAASFSGSVGGLVAYFTYNIVNNTGVLDKFGKTEKQAVKQPIEPGNESDFFDATVKADIKSLTSEETELNNPATSADDHCDDEEN
jgi:energy-coupling factor transport system substrate-specific component